MQVFQFTFSVYFLFSTVQFSNQETIPRLKKYRGWGGGHLPPPLPLKVTPMMVAAVRFNCFGEVVEKGYFSYTDSQISCAVGKHSLVISFSATFTLKINGTSWCSNKYCVVFEGLSFKFRIAVWEPLLMFSCVFLVLSGKRGRL
jgi:hypothetical protein